MPTPADVVSSFFHALGARDTGAALALLAPDAEVEVLPAAGQTSMDPAASGRAFFAATVEAFPDLFVTVHRTSDLGDGVVLAEISVEGTQAADYLGAVNQEKHLDLRQAWLLTVRDGLIHTVKGFWDENQLFRRLAVKRLDRIAIVAITDRQGAPA
ncbi:nuclear transport factor 2 family protein [Pseudonocardia sp.]|uniref:nuclear transport factor 2 family protein n=1 Tax=Pseudonocardia sp. TaxID=60912 RepID=UPI002610CECB|nr:nuclear transport factor 2 family protein [Pseudonocardia sp.]